MNRSMITGLTPLEYTTLVEAVRFSQQASREDTGKLDPVLSRIQKKLGRQAGDE